MKIIRYDSNGRNGSKSLFFPLFTIRPIGRIFCSPEQSKLCFELLGINSAPQNHLPLQGA